MPDPWHLESMEVASFIQPNCNVVLVSVFVNLGHLCYYKDNPFAQKLSVDSLFVLRRGRRSKFQHIVVNARSAGMLA